MNTVQKKKQEKNPPTYDTIQQGTIQYNTVKDNTCKTSNPLTNARPERSQILRRGELLCQRGLAHPGAPQHQHPVRHRGWGRDSVPPEFPSSPLPSLDSEHWEDASERCVSSVLLPLPEDRTLLVLRDLQESPRFTSCPLDVVEKDLMV